MKKKYQNTLSIGLSPFFLIALFTIQVDDAAAQECASDSECADGEFCEFDPLIEYCENPEPGTEWACEDIEEATGSCEDATGRCQDDSDCDEDFSCRKHEMGIATSGCAPGQDCTNQKPVELTPIYGYCRAESIVCEDDSDCPSPLFCESPDTGGCSISSDGESDCPFEIVKICSYEPAECATDDDCESGYECVEAGTEEECSPADAAMPMDEPEERPVPDEECVGEDCRIPAESEAMPEIECTTRMINICFPVRVDCQDNSDCQEGESCFDFSGTVDAPDFWDDDEEAVVCLPDGWVAIFNGHVEGQGSSDLSGEIAEPASASSDYGNEEDTRHTTSTLSDDEGSDVDKGKADDESDDSGGGCSVAFGGEGNIIYCFMLLGFVVTRQWFRRSRRARRC